jgi:hypothetical protein
MIAFKQDWRSENSPPSSCSCHNNAMHGRLKAVAFAELALVI